MTAPQSPTALDLDAKPPVDIATLSTDEKKELVIEARSITSLDTDAETLAPDTESSFSRKLHINAHGIALVRLPVPSRELEVPITDSAGQVVYSSIRDRVRSGNATLVDASGRSLVRSEYFFGPGRDPKIYLLDGDGDVDEKNEVKVQGKWTSREQRFTMPSGISFIWRYRRQKNPETGKKLTLLVLEVQAPHLDTENKASRFGKKPAKTIRVAQLIRGEEARTPGTKRCDAGNGGDLMIDEVVLKEAGVSEELVVASAVMMLKKEIDRRRTAQMIVLSAVISGGAS